jgi:hypothetical protein
VPSGGTCLLRGAVGNCGGGNGNSKGSGMDEKLGDLANMRQKETREDRDDADERGGQSPVRLSGYLDRGITWGQ